MSKHKASLNWLTEQAQEMRKILIEWSDINSGSYHLVGLERMQKALQKQFIRLQPDSVEELVLTPLERVNSRGQIDKISLGKALRFKKRADAPIKIMLCGHMDTVFGEHDDFQTARFIDENTLNGPGVADMKGGLTVMLYALLALERSEFAEKIGWEILLNPDEEIGSYGSAPFLIEGAKRNNLGLIFEPAMTVDGTLAGERKGSGNFAVVAHGVAAHAGRAHHLGRNAIRALADFIQLVDDLNGKREGVTLNVGRVEGGGATNVVPDLAICYIDVRTKQESDEKWLLENFEKIIGNINTRDGFHLDLHGSFSRKPKPLVGKTLRLFELVKKVGEELNLSLSWQPSGGCCDGNNLASVGLPVVDTLGVRGGNIHSAEEFMKIDSLVERAQLTALLMLKLASGEASLGE